MSAVVVVVKRERHGTITGYTTDRCRCAECVDNWNNYQVEWRARRRADLTAPHNRVTYLSGCRCDECRSANAAYNMRRKAAVRRDGRAIPHGTVDGYGSYGCRCEACSSAKKDATRDHYVRHQLDFLERTETRRCRKANDARSITARDIRRLFGRFDGCAYCGSSERIELDHVVPLARGGRHSIGNLLPACRRCNRNKHSRLLIEWAGRPR